jgi:hypothetical protein
MTSNPNDQLLAHLIELQRELEKEKIPLILGGGMSLYVRMQYLRATAPDRYPFSVETRSTNDLDLFLASALIVDAEKVEKLREIIVRLAYTVDPNAKNFQFVKEVEIYGGRRQVRVELLAAPPSETQMDKVDVKGFRIKPVGVDDIHAYLTASAGGIDIGQLKAAVPAGGSSEAVITIPSAYNYLILKLHAFDDRKSKKDAKSDEGRHHTYDIFVTVTRMNEEDWTNAAAHLKTQAGSDYLKRAIQIQKDCFSVRTGVGLLRLQENETYRRNRVAYDPYLDQFIKDMADLFAGNA